MYCFDFSHNRICQKELVKSIVDNHFDDLVINKISYLDKKFLSQNKLYKFFVELCVELWRCKSCVVL